ncbi:LuxR C-terminal-related transcriptional regulator [Microbacterium sp. B2969]|uniref:LuxR C-terminal-related transcriptional regulator n=1 Tax=Microbacterium alkaliflavum TaxID=3248839 RepID=A0ABW7Q5W3_9MICO
MYPATKFRAPTVSPRSITRDGLVADADDLPAIVLVRAPAGYGKTTAVSQWLQELELAADPPRRAWVSLDEDDDDQTGFWDAVAAALTGAELEGAATSATTDLGTVRSKTVIPLIDALAASERRWVIVLDDLHRIHHDDTLASLDWFVARMPENVTIVLITRTPPALPSLDGLRARAALRELSGERLRLDDRETAAVLRDSYGLELGPDDVDRVIETTSGWPAAVALVGSAVERGIAPSQAMAVRVDSTGIGALVRQGLAGSAPDDYSLLLCLSVFERFTADIVSEVVQDERAWPAAMDVAARSGLVATLDDDEHWWRMHHLVREHLHAELGRTDPMVRRELHERAAVAFERENDIAATMHHLLGAADYDAIADILSNVRANSMVPRQALGLSWLERIPESALDHDPRLAFWEAWASATGGDPTRRDRALARGRLAAAARKVEAFDSWDDVEDFVHASACYSDVGDARRAAERFLTRYGPEAPLTPLVENRLGTMLYLEGRCDEALAVFDRLDAGGPVARPLRLLIPAYRALCLLERGDVDAASREVDRGAEARVAFRLGLDHVYLPAEQALARLQTETGGPALGRATAANALERAREHGDTVLVVPHLLLELARADHALARPGDAAVALNQAEELCRDAPDPGALPARIATLRHRFAFDDPSGDARERLSRRELDVLTLLPGPMSATAIASELFISVNTARTHIKSIYRKLGVTTRADAIAAARRAALIS